MLKNAVATVWDFSKHELNVNLLKCSRLEDVEYKISKIFD